MAAPTVPSSSCTSLLKPSRAFTERPGSMESECKRKSVVPETQFVIPEQAGILLGGNGNGHCIPTGTSQTFLTVSKQSIIRGAKTFPMTDTDRSLSD